MIEAISIGAAVTSHTRCPWSRWSWARARVPGQIRCAIASSKISSPSSSSSDHGVPGDEAERGVAGVGDVLGVLDADDPEVRLLPGGAEDLAGGEELAPVQARGRGGRCWRPASRCCRRRRTPPTSGRRGCPARSRPRRRTPPPRPRASSAAAGSAGVGAGRRAGSHGQRRPLWEGPVRGPLPCGRIAHMPAKHDVADLVADAAAERPDALAVVEAGGRSADLGRSSRTRWPGSPPGWARPASSPASG